MKIKDFIKVCLKTNGKCFYCNKSAEAIDHFTSIKQWEQEYGMERESYDNAVDNIDNLVLCCNTCNSQKGAKDPGKFMKNDFVAMDRMDRANRRIGLLNGPTWRQIIGLEKIT